MSLQEEPNRSILDQLKGAKEGIAAVLFIIAAIVGAMNLFATKCQLDANLESVTLGGTMAGLQAKRERVATKKLVYDAILNHVPEPALKDEVRARSKELEKEDSELSKQNNPEDDLKKLAEVYKKCKLMI
ncbi:hypothetical protein [Synechococcus sp. CS-205]|uniref:hypothetical protein n=1 Tax=Synechococcus sp. CS-205 TaxID=2847984 RepID=UPI00223B7E5D|nr:hypothetical protein [Synechococcus sp. CS-205]MCT0249540.1 hypothetical protein [Synechococcus sp. CS-205]